MNKSASLGMLGNVWIHFWLSPWWGKIHCWHLKKPGMLLTIYNTQWQPRHQKKLSNSKCQCSQGWKPLLPPAIFPRKYTDEWKMPVYDNKLSLELNCFIYLAKYFLQSGLQYTWVSRNTQCIMYIKRSRITL